MARRKQAIPLLIFDDEAPKATLKKQSRYGTDPWQPGEIPRGFIKVHSGPKKQAPYGEFLSIKTPFNRGKKAPNTEESE